MIHLTLSGFMLFYLLLLVGAIAWVWVAGEAARIRETRRLRRSRTLCRVCGVIYEDRSEDPLPLCPVCRHPNERSNFQQI